MFTVSRPICPRRWNRLRRF